MTSSSGIRQGRHQEGQTLVELAIFGMLAIMALGFLIRIGLAVNYQQEIRMNAFRRALAIQHADNSGDEPGVLLLAQAVAGCVNNAIGCLVGTGQPLTSDEDLSTDYWHLRDRQVPDPSTIGLMPRTRVLGTSRAVWADRFTFLPITNPTLLVTGQWEPVDLVPELPELPEENQPKTIVRVNEARKEFLPQDLVRVQSFGIPLIRSTETSMSGQAIVTQHNTGSSLSALQTDSSTTELEIIPDVFLGTRVTIDSTVGSNASLNW